MLMCENVLWEKGKWSNKSQWWLIRIFIIKDEGVIGERKELGKSCAVIGLFWANLMLLKET